MKQVLGAINRQAEVNYAQVLNRTLLPFHGKMWWCSSHLRPGLRWWCANGFVVPRWSSNFVSKKEIFLCGRL